MSNYNNYFEGYNVPERIKEVSILIIKRFIINGSCDGMYIANSIGFVSKIGDGKGNFYSDKIVNEKEIAEDLQNSYGCNISKEDITELTDIITTKQLNVKKAIDGINEYISKCKKEKQSCDEWRIEYLDRCIEQANKNLLNITE